LELASQEPNRFEIIDTNAFNELEVHEKIKSKILKIIDTRLES
jgi:thymidylate kinase